MLWEGMAISYSTYEPDADNVPVMDFDAVAYGSDDPDRGLAVRNNSLEGLSVGAKRLAIVTAGGLTLTNLIDAKLLTREFGVSGGEVRGKPRDHVQGVVAMVERAGGNADDVKRMLSASSKGARGSHTPDLDLEPESNSRRRPSSGLGAPKPAWVM